MKNEKRKEFIMENYKQWFKDAKFGMMIHFGLKGSQMQLRDEKRAKYLNEEISRLPKIEMK